MKPLSIKENQFIISDVQKYSINNVMVIVNVESNSGENDVITTCDLKNLLTGEIDGSLNSTKSYLSDYRVLSPEQLKELAYKKVDRYAKKIKKLGEKKNRVTDIIENLS